MIQLGLKEFEQGVATMRKSHCSKILKLLKTHHFVPSRAFQEFTLSHTRRIKDLRDGKYNGIMYKIESCKNKEGVYGYKLEGSIAVCRNPDSTCYLCALYEQCILRDERN